MAKSGYRRKKQQLPPEKDGGTLKASDLQAAFSLENTHRIVTLVSAISIGIMALLTWLGIGPNRSTASLPATVNMAEEIKISLDRVGSLVSAVEALAEKAEQAEVARLQAETKYQETLALLDLSEAQINALDKRLNPPRDFWRDLAIQILIMLVGIGMGLLIEYMRTRRKLEKIISVSGGATNQGAIVAGNVNTQE